MSKVALSGNALGTGTVTLAAPNTNSTVTLNLPDTAGTVLIQDGANTTTVVNLTATGTVNVGGGNISPQTGFKNRIINGAMTIDQRNAGASVTFNDGVFVVDRFGSACSQTSKATAQQSTTVPTGFKNSIQITSSSAYSVLAGDFFNLYQNIEGLNVFDFAWGTANAQPITISFWVRSSLTGTFGGSISNSGLSRSYPFTYTISAANTYEYKTVTIAGDTSGTWLTTTGIGLRVYFGLGVGTTYSGTAGTWAATRYQSATGAVSLVGTSGATWNLSGLQVEKGSTATPFEFRSFGDELLLCQRYYEVIFHGNNSYKAMWTSAPANFFGAPIYFKVEKRVAPTIPQFTSGSQYWVIPGTTGVDTFTPHVFNAAAINTHNFTLNSPGISSTAANAGMYSWEGTITTTASAEI
jgi:hypothetical protein